MKSKSWASEADMAAAVVAWIQEQGWTVHQEVAPWGWGSALDILAVRGPVLWAIECKLAMGLPVIEQAERWLAHAHMVSVATPPHGKHWRIARVISDKLGIGLLEVTNTKGVRFMGDAMIDQNQKPAQRLQVDSFLQDHLARFHADTCPAGCKEGVRMTPWRATVERIRALALESPGMRLRDALGRIDHSTYGSADSGVSALARIAKQGGGVPGLRLERKGRIWRVYATEEAA